MSTIIKLLERMGNDAILTNLTEFHSAINETNLSSELKTALMNKDTNAVIKQMDVCPDIYCLLFPADENENEESEEAPSEDKSEISL
ncbi:hypothetical protein L2735_02750 [Shewanella olleyana]|uniref:hypothetical protein n=1 Tax=Shewanella olleyana TaxID=135626 RepID=UPI0020102CA8|nr:hypothetical protein [Shewanella olleyana]MCL1065727.1 hypothetical protein [Shewanella olleyana]